EVAQIILSTAPETTFQPGRHHAFILRECFNHALQERIAISRILSKRICHRQPLLIFLQGRWPPGSLPPTKTKTERIYFPNGRKPAGNGRCSIQAPTISANRSGSCRFQTWFIPDTMKPWDCFRQATIFLAYCFAIKFSRSPTTTSVDMDESHGIGAAINSLKRCLLKVSLEVRSVSSVSIS